MDLLGRLVDLFGRSESDSSFCRFMLNSTNSPDIVSSCIFKHYGLSVVIFDSETLFFTVSSVIPISQLYKKINKLSDRFIYLFIVSWHVTLWCIYSTKLIEPCLLFWHCNFAIVTLSNNILCCNKRLSLPVIVPLLPSTTEKFMFSVLSVCLCAR